MLVEDRLSGHRRFRLRLGMTTVSQRVQRSLFQRSQRSDRWRDEAGSGAVSDRSRAVSVPIVVTTPSNLLGRRASERRPAVRKQVSKQAMSSVPRPHALENYRVERDVVVIGTRIDVELMDRPGSSEHAAESLVRGKRYDTVTIAVMCLIRGSDRAAL